MKKYEKDRDKEEMSTVIHKDIKSIAFGILSPEEIRQISVCEITSSKMKGPGTVYDESMGALTGKCGGMCGKRPQMCSGCCKTCSQDTDMCPGHFGHIELAQHIIHPMYYKMILNFLRCFCSKCSKLLIKHELIYLHKLDKLDVEVRFNKILERIEKVEMCCYCCNPHPKIMHSISDNVFIKKYKDESEKGKSHSYVMSVDEIKRLFDNIPDEDIAILGFDTKYTHPKNLIFSVLPVVPPCTRPYIVADGNICDDDLTNQYIEIIKANNILNNPKTSDKEMTKALQTLKFRIQTLFDNSKGRAKHTTNQRPIKAIKERLMGKDGQIRNNHMGKRVNYSSRTVIGGDPTLEIDELGVPNEICDILSYPEFVTSLNIDKLTQLVNDGKANSVVNNSGKTINLQYALIKKGTELMYGDVIIRNGRRIKYVNQENFVLYPRDILERNGEIIEIKLQEKKHYTLQVGNIVNRQLQNGDFVLFNRQPTLHKGSMLGFRVKRLPGKTFRINLAVTPSFNADFDGDEMNLHAPRSCEAVAELAELSSVKKNMISPQGGQCSVAIVQDSMAGAFLMTRRKEHLTKGQFFQLFNFMSMDKINKKIQHIRKVLKNDLNLKSFAFTGKGAFSMLLPDDFHYENKNDADTKEPTVKIYKGVLYEGSINKKNLGKGHQSLILLIHKEYGNEMASKFVDQVQFLTNNYLLIEGFSIGITDCIATKKDEIENVLLKCYMEADEIDKTISHPGIKEMRLTAALNKARDVGLRIANKSLDDNNTFKITTTAGSKGEVFNIAQIAGLLGQQNLKGKRIPMTLNNGKRTLSAYPFEITSNEQKYESRGFIKNSFATGLNPREFYFHAMTGREGITDTALGTAKSGYIQRRIVKLLEDIQIRYDGSARNAVGSIYQLTYGENGFDPSKTVVVNNQHKFCDVSRLTNKLNISYESKISVN